MNELVVKTYSVQEMNRRQLAMCEECTFIPTWEVRLKDVQDPAPFYACSEHVDTVLFNVSKGRYDTDGR